MVDSLGLHSRDGLPCTHPLPHRRMPRHPILLLSVVTLALGCENQTRQGTSAERNLQQDLDTAAAHFAHFLASETNRSSLNRAMQRSERNTHALDLAAYVNDLRADPELPQASSLTRIVDILREYSDLHFDLVMPTSWDRTRWVNTSDIVVTAESRQYLDDGVSDLEQEDFLALRIRDVYSVAFRTDSSHFLFLPTDPLPYPILAIRRSTGERTQRDFIDSIPRNTIATRAEEYGLRDEELATFLDDRSSWPGAEPLFSLVDCTLDAATRSAGKDVDGDGLLDACELTIAKMFRPRLQMHIDEEHSDHRTFWQVRRPTLGEVLEEQDPVRRRYKNELWIFYGLAYYYDPGRYKLTWHHGDSEFIVVSAAPVNGEESDSVWTLTRLCFASHWGEDNEFHRCYDADDAELQFVDDKKGGRPLVWVAYNKHGTYPNASVCNNKKLVGPVKERCGDTDSNVFDVVISQRYYLGEYRPSWMWVTDPDSKYREGIERPWHSAPFCGWYIRRRYCADTYLRALKAWGFVADTVSGFEAPRVRVVGESS